MIPRFLPSILSVIFIFSFLLFNAAVILHFVNVENVDVEISSKIYDSSPYDVFLFSAYYYESSASLGDSSIAILMSGDFEILEKIGALELLALNSTDRMLATAPMERVTIHDACKWITILSKTTLLPNLTQLFVSLGGKHAQIPFQMVQSTPKRPVVFCISPLFAAENWKDILVALHIYKRFGAHLNMYIRSIVSPIFEILRVYESEGYVSLRPWNRIKLLNHKSHDFNPNLNVEFRSQDAEQTDCLLYFKESAEFIGFLDLDDILIPRLADSYLPEFRFFTSEHPNAAFFRFTKENIKSKAYKRGNMFSIEHLLRNMVYENVTETGKIIARPSKLNSTWIHWPYVKHEMYQIDGIVGDEDLMEIPVYAPSIGVKDPLLSEKNIKLIQADYNRMSWKSAIRRHLRHLPTHPKYGELIGKCFKEKYYKFHESHQQNIMRCPGPERCNISTHRTRCWNSVGEFHSTRDGDRLNIHFVENTDFSLSDMCIV